jgi:flagellar biosynthesis GTPase FlhF
MEGTSASGASTSSATSGEGGNAQGAQQAAESTKQTKETAQPTEKEAAEKKETKSEKPEGEQKEEKKEKSQKELFFERHKKDYPDDDEKDEELFWKRRNERMAEYDKLKKSDDDFRKVIGEHPQFGGMFLDAADGKDFFESLLGRFSKEDIMAAYDDPEKAKSLSEAYGKHLKDSEARKKFMEEGEKNIKEDTIPRFLKYCEANKIEGEEMDALWKQINDFYDEGSRGKYSDKLFDMFRKAANYDADMENARQEGELKGHNAKVQATLAKGKAPSGLPPTFDGGQGGVAPEPKPKNKKTVRNPFRNEDMEIDED